MTADDFPRLFASAFCSQDARALAALLAEDAEIVTATGCLADGRDAAEAVLAGEFEGVFRTARLVTGKTRFRVIGPGATMLSQRFVLTGALDAEGAELPRATLLLSAVLAARAKGWQALTAQITVLSDQR
ncbi:MAG: hypothetical protein RIT14_360 [Pseudomonadota bacterium]